MRVVGWNNGSPNNKTGAGYGIRMSLEDRDRYFRKEWASVVIGLNGNGQITVSISNSFWRHCTELRSAQIGRWMLKQGLAPWTKGSPPKLKLTPLGNKKFRLSGI